MADYTQTQGHELDWDGVIENDSSFPDLLPPGDYDFTVKSMERGRHNGSEKLPPCGKAVLTLEMRGVNVTGEMRHNLFLYSSMQRSLCAFFVAIGQQKKGDSSKMNWNRVVGASGRAKVSVRKYTSKSGIERESNDIKEFYEAVAPTSVQPTQPNSPYQQPQHQMQQFQQPPQQYQQAAQQPPANYQAGRF